MFPRTTRKLNYVTRVIESLEFITYLFRHFYTNYTLWSSGNDTEIDNTYSEIVNQRPSIFRAESMSLI